MTVAVTGAMRVERAFARAREERRLALAVYLTVGYPDRSSTGALLRAALDDRAALHGEVLMAEQAGEIRAALSLQDGRTVANPFAPTAKLVEMLRMHPALVETVAA